MARSSTTFEPGNVAAMRHGARSRSAIQKAASEMRDELAELLTTHLPHVGPADQPLVDLAVDVVTKLRLVNQHLDRTSGGSLIDMRGRPRSCSALYLALSRQALATFSELGIGPRSRATILSGLGLAAAARAKRVEEAHARLKAHVAADLAEEAS
ncbi:MAG TPA: hypothetical protein VKD46_06500 [bacterium]|nr:hypothetical protein [bacterium]